MTRRSPKKSSLAPRPSSQHTVRISDVQLGAWCVLEDGRRVRRACDLNGHPFVRGEYGLECLPRDALVTDVEAPELVAADRGAVKDPLAT